MTLVDINIGILQEGCWLTPTRKQWRKLRSIDADLAVFSKHIVNGWEMNALVQVVDWCEGLRRYHAGLKNEDKSTHKGSKRNIWVGVKRPLSPLILPKPTVVSVQKKEIL